MSDSTTGLFEGTVPGDVVTAAVAAAFADADYRPEAAANSITPLKLLTSEQPLRVNELTGLTRATAASYLLGQFGRSVTLPGDEEQPLSGLLFANARGGWILINRDSHNPLVRRRFSVAHELGHYLLHVRPLLRSRRDAQFTEVLMAPSEEESRAAESASVLVSSLDGEPVIQESELDRWEEEADRFAAAVLMPEVTCRAWVERLAGRYGGQAEPLARRLATDFLVSQTAMQRRLRDLGLL